MFLLLQGREEGIAAQPAGSGGGSLEKEDKQLGNNCVMRGINDGNNVQHANNILLLH